MLAMLLSGTASTAQDDTATQRWPGRWKNIERGSVWSLRAIGDTIYVEYIPAPEDRAYGGYALHRVTVRDNRVTVTRKLATPIFLSDGTYKLCEWEDINEVAFTEFSPELISGTAADYRVSVPGGSSECSVRIEGRTPFSWVPAFADDVSRAVLQAQRNQAHSESLRRRGVECAELINDYARLCGRAPASACSGMYALINTQCR